MVAGVTSTVFFNEIQYSNNGDPDTGDFIKIGPIAQIPGAQNTGQTLILSTSATPDIVINEVLFDPENDPASAGDANGDGTRSASQDEFIEILNTTGGDIDISGWTLSDDDGDDFTFPSGSVLGAGQAAVLFGGGSPAGNVGDGNLHYSACEPKDAASPILAEHAAEITQIVHDQAMAHSGSISAEHGVGRLKRDELETLRPPAATQTMKAIKTALDPDGIMNPNRVVRVD